MGQSIAAESTMGVARKRHCSGLELMIRAGCEGGELQDQLYLRRRGIHELLGQAGDSVIVRRKEPEEPEVTVCLA